LRRLLSILFSSCLRIANNPSKMHILIAIGLNFACNRLYL
jgi:hypothetical protein